MRVRVQPNLAWAIAFLLALLWLTGVMKWWVALPIFLGYLVVAAMRAFRDPQIMEDAEEFARQREARKQARALRDSVKIRRRDP